MRLKKGQLAADDAHPLRFRSLPKRLDHRLPISPDRQPNLPPECSFILRREFRVHIGPERLQTRGTYPSNRIEESSVVESSSPPVPSLLQVVVDEPLEVIELAVGYEDGCECSIAVLPDVQQLDSGPLARQTLEGQLDVGKALEFDAQSQLVEVDSLLCISSGISLAPYRFQLALQRAAVTGTILRGHDSTTSALLWRPIRLRFREARDDEVSTSSVRPVRHVSAGGYVCLAASLSAMVRRSFSITRMSASRIGARS